MENTNTLKLKNLKDMENLLESHKDSKFTNGFIFYIFLQLGKNVSKTAEHVVTMAESNCHITSVKSKVSRINEQVKLYKRNIHNNWNNIVEFFDSEFKFPERKHTLPSLQPKHPPFISPVKTRIERDCQSCKYKRQTNSELLAVNRKLNFERRFEMRERIRIKKTYQVKRVNDLIKRKTSRISRYQLKTKQLEEVLSSLHKSLKKSHLKCQFLLKENTKLKKEIATGKMYAAALQTKIESHDYTVYSMEKKMESLTEEILELKKVLSTKENKKQFHSKIRLIIYSCIECNVPVNSISKVITACASLCPNVTIESLPNASTIAQMSREMGAIADLQLVDTLIVADCATLAFDATSLKGSHINQIHFGTKNNILTASIAELPGGKAEDYVQHILQTLDDLAETYSVFYSVNKDPVKRQICGKIVSTLTDRASANHAAISQLNVVLETELLELHCHLHPLDGIASEVRKELTKTNAVTSKTYGSDCKAANLLYSISKLRYKAKGDPSGFKSFLKKNGLPCSTFPRYVGNRLHILFHSSGVVYRHKQLLIQYLEKYCNNTTTLRSAILEDLKNDILMAQLQVLGLWGKMVTGPWMAIVYGSECQRNHLDMAQQIKTAVSFIERIAAEPEYLISTTFDAFGRPLILDDTLSALLIVDNTNFVQLNEIINLVATATSNVLNRQMSRYLFGDLADPTEELKVKAASAPAHNIWAERTLGIIDSLARRAPNASISFLDGKAKFQVNKTLEWLSTKPTDEQDAIVKFSIQRGATIRTISKERKGQMEAAICDRLKEKGQKRDMVHRSRVGKEIKFLLEQNVPNLMEQKIFLALSAYQKNKVKDLLDSNPNKIEGARFQHIWNVDGQDTLFQGKIIMKSASPGKKIRIAYWKMHENEEDAEDVKLTLESILTDAVLNDLIFF